MIRRFDITSIVVTAFIFVCYIEAATMSDFEEHCLTEMFRAECAADEVVVMETAVYGRKETGRCVNKFIEPCEKNVLSIMDKRCSGRRLCEMSVSDPLLVRTEPCPIDYVPYLTTQHRCQKVFTKHDQECASFNYHMYVTIDLPLDEGYISSMYSSTTCPYKIEAAAGQRVILTLQDFEAYSNNTPSNSINNGAMACTQLISIREPSLGTATPICRNSSRNRDRLYISKTHLVEIEITAVASPFIVGYKVTGCPEIMKPKGSHFVEKTLTKVAIQCNKSKHRFEYSCHDNKWEPSPLRNCSDETLRTGSDHNKGSHYEDQEDSIGMPPLVLTLLIIFGTALVVVIYVAGMIVCVMYLRRKRKPKSRPTTQSRNTGSQEDVLQYDKIFTNPHEERLPMLSKISTLRSSKPQSDYSETVCHVHGPISTSESPYIVAGTNYNVPVCQCDACASSRAKGVQNCCLPASTMPSNKDNDDNNQSTYESSRSLKGVRFATLNSGSGGNKPPKSGPFYLELNSRGLNNGVRDACPDVLLSDRKDVTAETQLSSFR